MSLLTIPLPFFSYSDGKEEYKYHVSQQGIDVKLFFVETNLEYNRFFAWGSTLKNNNNNDVIITRLLSGDDYRASYSAKFYVKTKSLNKNTLDISIAHQMKLLIKRNELQPIALLSDQEQSAANDIAVINADETIRETEKKRLISARIGQGKYRSDLLMEWQGCAVTGCTDEALLVASHIKPWSRSTNEERLDPNNGLLLVATLDKAFDRYLISFNDDGTILISKAFKDYALVGITSDIKIKTKQEHAKYLVDHRQQFENLQAI